MTAHETPRRWPARLWAVGLLRRRAGRIAATACGVAVAVALLASLGAFLVSSRATMTARAVRDVGVDWQVQVQPGADPAAVLDLVRADPGTAHALPVGFERVDGLAADAGGITRTTGAATIVGLPDGYRATFPRELRTLVGADTGVLLAQQTAANLGVAPGGTVTITLSGGSTATVPVDGVVDLPDANALFQTVGTPPGAQPTAPPDNVVLLPEGRWTNLFAPLASATAAPDGVTTQVHVARGSALAADPAAAYVQETGSARNLEAGSAGTAVVGDNLGAALDAARSDAAYAQVLFLFLGLPGAVLAALVTVAVAGAGASRRRREQALARVRGAGTAQILRLASVEALLVGAGGAVAGLAVGGAVGGSVFAAPAPGVAAPAAGAWAWWATAAALAGFVVAALSVVAPAWLDLRRATVSAARRTVDPPAVAARPPWWARIGLDVALLVGGALLVRAASGRGYALVLAPEGVPTVSVSYWAFTGPALLWVGSGLLAWRLTDLVLRRPRRLRSAVRPVAGELSSTAAAMMSRRRRPLARSVALLGLALAFAASTATFNATYRAQAEVDAQLTNGADVAVTEPAGIPVGPDAGGPLTRVPGVRAVEPLQHRYAYIGTDLQDLYGVRPGSITGVTALQDAYFQGGTARSLMDRLAAAPDSILVSAETVQDYQLVPGDTVNLRLPDRATGRPVTVPFRYAGIVSEFPTAPRDSFFVANADYVAARTGSDAVGTFLVDTGGRDITRVATDLRALLGTSATVTDVADTRSRVGSSLTSVDLAALTRVELGFALVLAASAGGLVSFLGLTERRRSFAIIELLGATSRQSRALISAEVLVLAVGGLLTGGLVGLLLARVLVAVLTGVFDPPPAAVTVPWTYLVTTAGICIVALGAAAEAAGRRRRGSAVELLREV
jgi:putative ABC transport system permease protein